jgi:hypothetical protein
MIYSAGPNSPFGICFGERPRSADQVLTAFKNWHDTHPGLWNYSFTTGVIRALSETWPCKGNEAMPNFIHGRPTARADTVNDAL